MMAGVYGSKKTTGAKTVMEIVTQEQARNTILKMDGAAAAPVGAGRDDRGDRD